MLTQMTRIFSATREWQLLLLLFLIALLVRIVGINYGYWHGDERINDAAKVLTGELVPGQHFYPPLLNYINAIFFGILYVIGRLIPVWYSAADFRAQYFSDPTAFYLTARLVTAAMSALTAPLFYLIAKALRFDKNACIVAGVFGVLIPVMVLLSHLSKSDVPLATTAVLIFYLMIKKYQRLELKRYDFLLGLSIALAMSFKHSYIFILIPLSLGHLYLLFRATNFRNGIMSLLYVASVMIPAWCIFNIGILLDFQNFLDFQKIQSQMSVRANEPLFDAFSTWFLLAAHNSYGVNLLATLFFILFPVYLNSPYCGYRKERALFNIFWVSVALGTVVVTIMSGTRQHSGLWVPYFTCMQFFAALLVLDLIRSKLPIFRLSSVGVIGLSFVLSLYGSLMVWKQSLAAPIANKVAKLIQENYTDKKIVTSFIIRLPQAKAAQNQEFSRHDRLAKKYDVVMPERSAERYIVNESASAIYYVNMPMVMFGLEHTDDESLGDSIKPYTWPLQQEEWQLDHWLALGFELFVVSDFDYYLNEVPTQTFRDYYRDMLNRCERVQDFMPEKPFFLEAEVSVFDCSSA